MTVKVHPSECFPREKCRSPEALRGPPATRLVKNPIILVLLRTAAHHRRGNRRAVTDSKLVETGLMVCEGLEDAGWEVLMWGL